ncbi:MAG: DUF523 and DUF1722 domain-containing protein [Deltaproteobacteria bacterium]|nr:DUF523 and DUF1722 domain-containing protein [Deltaproteobacteria bacterium]
MEFFSALKPKIGISACLLGQKVRFDGGHKRDPFLTETFGAHVEWVPVCPELEAGMGVPRESVRLVGTIANPRMIAERSGKDWTDAMNAFAARRLDELRNLALSGYVLKKNSPSCGLERVRVYNNAGMPNRTGRGLFAAALIKEFPLLPAEEEGRLNDPKLRENFIERVFAYHRWQVLTSKRKSIAALVSFHTQHKFLLLAHNEQYYRQLGRLVAAAKKTPMAECYNKYGQLFMTALAAHATPGKEANVMEHMLGYFSQALTSDERVEILNLIRDYRRRFVPLIVPITLIKHYVNKYQVDYLKSQVYLEPSPRELMLRNHV